MTPQTCPGCDYHTVAKTTDAIGDKQYSHMCWAESGSPTCRTVANTPTYEPPTCRDRYESRPQ